MTVKTCTMTEQERAEHWGVNPLPGEFASVAMVRDYGEKLKEQFIEAIEEIGYPEFCEEMEKTMQILEDVYGDVENW